MKIFNRRQTTSRVVGLHHLQVGSASAVQLV
jgi:hypothetical protein